MDLVSSPVGRSLRESQIEALLQDSPHLTNSDLAQHPLFNSLLSPHTVRILAARCRARLGIARPPAIPVARRKSSPTLLVVLIQTLLSSPTPPQTPEEYLQHPLLQGRNHPPSIDSVREILTALHNQPTRRIQ